MQVRGAITIYLYFTTLTAKVVCILKGKKYLQQRGRQGNLNKLVDYKGLSVILLKNF
jgi:hypothetical protein